VPDDVVVSTVNDPLGHDQTGISRGQRLGALGAFALPLVVYLLTLAPTITWAHDGADGGDLITAAHTLGVPHPPGYPTYCLLGWLFVNLPLRDVAWRLNLMSAIGAALTALGVYATVLEWRRGRQRAGQDTVIAGLGAAWGVAFVPLLWSQALITEVYAVNAAFTVLVLWLALRVRRAGASPVALGLAWGLSLATHLTGVALLPIVVWALADGWRGRSFTTVSLLWLLGAMLGLTTYVYLPLRAGQGAVTWGNPTTPAGWWWIVSGTLYRGYVFALPLEAVPHRLLALVRHLVSGFGPTGIALSTFGIDPLARRQQGLLLTSGLSWLLYIAYAIGYDTADSYVYLIPALIVTAFWLGEGLAEGLNRLRGRLGPRWGLAAGVCLACAGPLSALVLNYQEMDVHRDTLARDFGESVFSAVPERAVLLSTQDAHTFTLWYFQHVLGQRPDVAVVDTGLLGYDWYRVGLLHAYPGLVVSGGDGEELGRANAPRPICEVVGEENQWLRCTGGE
jgi:hypothetical protein